MPSARHSLTKFSPFYRAEIGRFHQSRNPSGGVSTPKLSRTPSRTRLRDFQSSVTPGTRRPSNERSSNACRVTRFCHGKVGSASLSSILGQFGRAIGVCRFHRIEGSVRYFYRLVRFVLVNDPPHETLRPCVCRHHHHTVGSRSPNLMLDWLGLVRVGFHAHFILTPQCRRPGRNDALAPGREAGLSMEGRGTQGNRTIGTLPGESDLSS